MIWHPRSDWVTTEPVTGHSLRWAGVDTVAIHYTAALNLIDGDPGEDWAKIPAYLRSIHHEYLTKRPQPNGQTGYSIGYNVAVDARGDAWELRGCDIKCAANAGHNDHTWAILVLVDGQSPVTDPAAETIRELVKLAEKRALRSLMVKGHRDLDATQCPGTGVYAQIQAGVFRPQTADRPRPVDPPVSEEDDDMPKPEMRRFTGYRNVFHFEAGHYSHGTKVTVKRAEDRGDELVVLDQHAQGLKSALRQSGLDVGDLVPE